MIVFAPLITQISRVVTLEVWNYEGEEFLYTFQILVNKHELFVK
jgi:hypothetical protein